MNGPMHGKKKRNALGRMYGPKTEQQERNNGGGENEEPVACDRRNE